MAEHADSTKRKLDRVAPVVADVPATQEYDDAVTDVADGHTSDVDPYEEMELHAGNGLSSMRLAVAVGVVGVAALGCVAGWFGYRNYEIRQAQAQRNEVVEVAKQGAVNLTTVDYTTVDADVARILDSATGGFHEDFEQRSQPFIEVVKQAQSKSQGTVTAAGLESREGDRAQVLVAVSVKTSNAGASDQQPRGWRMRITVEKVGDIGKVSNVQFVP